MLNICTIPPKMPEMICQRPSIIRVIKAKNQFKKPFRRQPLWSVDWSDYEPLEGGNTSVSALGAMSKVGKKPKEEQNELSKKHDKEAD